MKLSISNKRLINNFCCVRVNKGRSGVREFVKQKAVHNIHIANALKDIVLEYIVLEYYILKMLYEHHGKVVMAAIYNPYFIISV